MEAVASGANAERVDWIVNVCARGSGGWLFDDLREGFRRTKIPGIRVVTSEQPYAEADGWIFIRTTEAGSSPDLSRSVVCLHDLYAHNAMYSPVGSRRAVHGAGGLVLCHPSQRAILTKAGVNFRGKLILERPLGALRTFTVRERRPERFTVGWVGRNNWLKRPEWLVQTVERFRAVCPEVRVVLIGRGLGSIRGRIAAADIVCELHERSTTPIAKYPALYQGLDCLLITSSTEAGPLPLFEALASGVPVVSTPVGWASHFAVRAPSFVRLGSNAEQLADGLAAMWNEGEQLFEARSRIAGLADCPRLESWFVETLELSAALLALRGPSGGEDEEARAWRLFMLESAGFDLARFCKK